MRDSTRFWIWCRWSRLLDDKPDSVHGDGRGVIPQSVLRENDGGERERKFRGCTLRRHAVLGIRDGRIPPTEVGNMSSISRLEESFGHSERLDKGVLDNTITGHSDELTNRVQ